MRDTNDLPVPTAHSYLHHGRCDRKDEYEDMTFTIRCNDNMTEAGIIVMGLVDGQKEGYSITANIYDGAEINLNDFKEKTFTKNDVSGSIRGQMTFEVMKHLDKLARRSGV